MVGHGGGTLAERCCLFACLLVLNGWNDVLLTSWFTFGPGTRMKVFLCDLCCFVFYLGTSGWLALRAVCLLFDVWGNMLASSLSILCFWASYIVFFLLTENKLEWNCDRLSFVSALAVCTTKRGLEVSLSCFPGSEGGLVVW